jgi:hypothetical protein
MRRLRAAALAGLAALPLLAPGPTLAAKHARRAPATKCTGSAARP